MADPPPESAGPIPGKGVIRLHRQRGFFTDSLRAYRIRIDGNRVGKIAPGETKVFAVSPGEHRVRLTIDWILASREVLLRLGEDQLAELTCCPTAILVGPFAILAPHRYIRLDGPTIIHRTWLTDWPD